MSDDEIAQTKLVVVEKLKRSGEYDKMRAMIVAASIAALQEGGEAGESAFTVSPALTSAKTAGLVPFQVVGDWLRALGLNYTFQVLALEAGLERRELDAKRAAIATMIGSDAVKDDKNVPLLDQLIAAARVKLPPPSVANTTAPVHASNAAVVAPTPTAVKTHFRTVGAVPMRGKEKKAEDTKYEIYFWESGTFTRFDEIDDQPLQLGDLKKCRIYCFDAVDCVTADALEDCEIVVAACRGSVFLRECKNTKVTCACKQLRTRDCHNIDVRLYAMTDPVVESSSNIEIRPFNLRLPKLTSKILSSGLDPLVNRFVHIYDFTPARDGARPNFEVHHPNHGLRVETLGADLGTPEIPQPFVDILEDRLKPAQSSEEGPNKSHNIKTGSGAWTAASGAPPQDAKGAAAPASKAAATTAAPAMAAATTAAPATAAVTTAAPATAAVTTAAPASKAAATTAAPATAKAAKNSTSDGSDRYSDFSDDDLKDGSPMSSVHQESDDEF